MPTNFYQLALNLHLQGAVTRDGAGRWSRTRQDGRQSYVDDEVVQRLLKALDFLVFFAMASFYSTVFASRFDFPNGAAIVTFFSLALAPLCILLLRDLGLYKASALPNGGWTFLKSAATLFITGLRPTPCSTNSSFR